MRTMLRKVLLAGVVVALVVCESGTAGAQLPADPCAPLSQGQVASAVGVPVGPGTKITPAACQWMWTNKVTSTVRVTLQFVPGSDFAGMKAPTPGIKESTVAGLGDDAFFATIASLTTLTVKKGNVAFVVRVYGVTGQLKQESMEKTMAEAVLMRL